MLSFLRIKDFALIDSLELELGPGLTVLSGETGAGKSIILAAVNLLLGQRADSDLIRAGAEQAVVEAQLEASPTAELWARLAQEGLAEAPASELVLRRVVSRNGRNRVQVNGSLSTLALLAELGPPLMSLCGQHSHQLLLRPSEHLLLLDAYAGLEPARWQVGQAVRRVLDLEARMDGQRQAMGRREERRAYLRELIGELEEAGLDPGEEEALKQERRLLANAEQVGRLAEGVHQGLYAAEEGTVLEGLGRVRGLLADLAKLDTRVAELAAQVEGAFYALDDAAQQIRDYAERLVFDPARLDQVEGRLLVLQRLGRKYGGSVEAALATLERSRQELASLEQGEERLEALEKERAAALNQALELARQLSQGRAKAAGALARAAQAELSELGMAACQVEARLSPPEGQTLASQAGPLGLHGLEQAELYIAPNPGEGFKRLARIASGGELSRILLALRSLVAQQAGAPTLIFDEVDAGIGGATGSVVGKKLKALAGTAQVICITHLPQIAAWADQHYSVRKQTKDGRTVTVLTPLEGEARLAEITRMLSGDETAAAAREHARQMLKAAGQMP